MHTDIVLREQDYLTRHGHELPKSCRLGTMIEAPSLLFQLEELLASLPQPLGAGFSGLEPSERNAAALARLGHALGM